MVYDREKKNFTGRRGKKQMRNREEKLHTKDLETAPAEAGKTDAPGEQAERDAMKTKHSGTLRNRSIKQTPDAPLFHFRPLLFATLGSVCGILAFRFFLKGQSGKGFAVILVFAAFLGLCFSERKVPLSRRVLAAALAVAFALASASVAALRWNAYVSAGIPEQNYYADGVVDKVSYGENYTSFVLKRVKFLGTSGTYKTGYRVLVYAFGEERVDVSPGDAVRVYLRLKNRETEGEFADYSLVNKLRYQGTTYTEYVEVGGISPHPFDRVKRLAEDVIDKTYSKEGGAVAKGILFGDTSEIEREDLAHFRELGIGHLFAVSGLHIGFLYGVLLLFLRKLSKRNPLRVILPTILLVFYAGVCGFTPSSVRAVIMCLSSVTLGVIGLSHDRLNAVLLAGVTILLIEPFQLLSYGFLLSFSCVLSMIVIGPTFTAAFSKLPKAIAESLSVFFSVQIGVFPVQMALFSYAAPLNSLLNLVLIPFISVYYAVMVIGIFLTAIIPGFAGAMRVVASVLGFLCEVIGKIPSDFALISGWNLTYSMPLYYAGCLAVSYNLNLKRKWRIVFAISFFVAFAVLTALSGQG